MFRSNNYIPAEFAWDINVVHEALDVQGQVRGVGAHQLLELLTLLVESDQRSWLWSSHPACTSPQTPHKMSDQPLVKVFSSHFRVKGCREHLYGGKKTLSIFPHNRKDLTWRCKLSSVQTLSLPLLKAHTEDLVAWMTMSTNTTVLGFSSGVGRSCL